MIAISSPHRALIFALIFALSLAAFIPASASAQGATTAPAQRDTSTAPTATDSSPAARDPLEGLDAYVSQAVRDWGVPGLAIAVVSGDSVVFERGYGVRTLGRPERVDEHTLFANASTTKAFTAMLIQMLADSGLVALDTPVTRYLPNFQLGDPAATRAITVRDLLTHRSGLPEADWLWYGRDATLEQIVRRLRYVPPAAGLGTRFAYQNETFAAAGLVAARAAGAPWDSLVRARILQPLGMQETVTSTAEADARPNVATPHDSVDGAVRPIERYPTDNIAPAGAMYSSVSDMARWMRFLLDSGRVDAALSPDSARSGLRDSSRALVSAARVADAFTPQILVSPREFYPTTRLTGTNFTAYGLGWFLEDYRGEKVAFHTGSIDGMSALVGLIPARRVGVVIFANRDHSELRHALMYRVFDAYLGAPPRDWSGELRALYRAREERSARAGRALDASRVTGTSPSLPLARYAGTYADSTYGTATVRVENGRLVLRQGPLLVADLQHWNYDTFMARWRRRWMGRSLVAFELGTSGRVATLVVGDARLQRVRGVAVGAAR